MVTSIGRRFVASLTPTRPCGCRRVILRGVYHAVFISGIFYGVVVERAHRLEAIARRTAHR